MNADDTDTDSIEFDHDGVRVTKRVERGSDAISYVRFTLRTDRAEPVPLRLREPIPDDVPVDEVGFPPEQEAYWAVDGDELVYEADLPGDEAVETVYAVRGIDQESLPAFCRPATIEVGDDAPRVNGATDDAVADSIDAALAKLDGESDDGAAAEAPSDLNLDRRAVEGGATLDGTGASERTTGDACDGDTGGGADDVVEPGQSGSHAAEGTTDQVADGGVPIDGTGTGEFETPTLSAPEEGPLVEALTAEIEAGDVDDEQVAALREALGLSASNTFEARLRHLQSRLNDYEAYADAMEEFIGENGSGIDVVESVQAELSTVTARLDSMEDRLATVGERTTEVDDLAETVATIDEEMTETREAVENLQEALDVEQSWRDEVAEAARRDAL